MRVPILSIILIFNLSILGQITVPTNGCTMENFDNSNPWTFGGTNSSWTYANPNKAQITDDMTGGGKCLILGGNTSTSTYNSNEDSWAQSPTYDFSLITDPYLEFNFYWSNEGSTSYDEIWMEYSLNGGNSWQIVSPPTGTGGCYDQNWYNYPDNWGGNVGGCFSGLGGPTGWVTVRKCISSLGGEPQVNFRFRISTGTQCNNYGATLDNWSICDASINAIATAQCTGNQGEVSFTDWSYPCPDQWNWNFGDGSSSIQHFPTHIYANPGNYTVTLTVTSSNAMTSGCGTHSDQVTLNVTIPPSLSLSYSPNDICDDASAISPNGTNGIAGSYTSTTGLALNISNGEIDPQSSIPGNYQVTFTPNSACQTPVVSDIEILQSPSVNPIADQTYCSGDQVQSINFNTLPSGLGTSWTLTNGIDLGFGTNGTGSIPNFQAENLSSSPLTSTFSVTPISNNSCSGNTESFEITIGNLPNSDFSVDNITGCDPLQVTFVSDEISQNCNWNFGDGQTSNSCNNVEHVFNYGNYYVSYSVTTDLGCSTTTTYLQPITALQSPIANFDYSPYLITTENNVLELTNQSLNYNQIDWTINSTNGFYFSSTSEQFSVELPSDTGTYTICINATNANGCVDLFCDIIVVRNNLSFFIPNSFSPNQDGINDYFGAVYAGIEPQEFQFRIFDRWGQIVFSSTDMNILWDGKFKGTNVPEDTYIWKLTYLEVGDVNYKTMKGHINVLR